MFARFGRQIGAILLSLGVFLSGAAPAWARACQDPEFSPQIATMAMAGEGMDMQQPCAGMSKHTGQPARSPLKSGEGGCFTCTACVSFSALNQSWLPIAQYGGANSQVFPVESIQRGIAVRPALPPPIFLV